MAIRTESLVSSRRDLIRNIALGAVAGFSGASSLTEAKAATKEVAERGLVTPAYSTTHKVKPLNFNPAKLKGLSAGLIESHWSKNYTGSVKALNETNKRLSAAMSDAELPAFIYNDLKREHLMRTGSVVLHSNAYWSHQLIVQPIK